ncbi:MAG: class I SAM-dependent methyltransferase [Patescibacteria group bacterium]
MWKKYYKKHEKREPRKQLVRAVNFCHVKKGNALDLGSGTMIESKFLARKGFNVVAIDHAPESKKYAKNISKKITFKNISFKEYNYPKNTFDLITSQLSLHLYGYKGFNLFIKRIINSLKPKGIFVGQFFGVNDSWNTEGVPFPKYDYVFHTKRQVLKLLSPLKILELEEKEKDGKTIHGVPHHWHMFHFIARKR